MVEWRPIQLGDLVHIKHGFAFKGEFFSQDKAQDVLVTPGNFAIGGGFQWGKQKFYDGPIPEDYVLHQGDLVVTMTDLSKDADTLGYAAIVPHSDIRLLHNQRIGKVIARSREGHLPFLHWLMRSATYRHHVVSSASGSTVKHTSPTRILAFQFSLPPLEEQQAIASVLGALDDKIDLNRRMNETLEAMARTLFRDWFVDFGPTRAKMEGRAPYLAPDLWALFPDRLDEEGKPKGWETSALSGIARNHLRSCQPVEIAPDTPYIGLEHMPRRSIALDRWSTADKVESNKLRFRRGEVLFGKLRPYFHKVGVAPVDGVCTTDAVVVAPVEPPWASVVLMVLSSDDFVSFTDRGSTGTKMPRTSWREMSRFPVVLPSTVALPQAFEHLVAPMIDRVTANVHEANSLAATRDLLLPKLMSGEIRVRDAEKVLEPAL